MDPHQIWYAITINKEGAGMESLAKKYTMVENASIFIRKNVLNIVALDMTSLKGAVVGTAASFIQPSAEILWGIKRATQKNALLLILLGLRDIREIIHLNSISTAQVLYQIPLFFKTTRIWD